ncbi:MAG: hypothetical protein H7X84_02510 [Verrucomicrobia bacterium]|nr:hypothetical protein [Prolixibacteraceae bacterium]
MKTKATPFYTGLAKVFEGLKDYGHLIVPILLLLLLTTGAGTPVHAHCDSYDGPVIKDAVKALETKNVKLVLKWVGESQEKEITSLFDKTYSLRNGDKEVYAIVEKHFFETLVRLHRETEGAPYTGLKEAGTMKEINRLTDEVIASNQVDNLVSSLNKHIEAVVREKYQKVAELDKAKDQSIEKGREYVKAYVDYTHTLEAIHDIIDTGNGEQVHKH